MTTVALQKRNEAYATLRDALEKHLPRFKEVVPKSMSLERVKAVILASAAKNPQLLECTTSSIVMAAHQCLQLGLEPGGPLGHAYLVPYRNKRGQLEAQPIVGYQGMIELARRSKLLATIKAEVVFVKDKLVWAEGINPTLVHEPFLPVGTSNPTDFNRGHPIAAYAVAGMTDGAMQFTVMTLPELLAIRDRSRAKSSGPWVTDFVEMLKKTVLRRIFKMLPKTIELAQALQTEDDAEGGRETIVGAEVLELPEAVDQPVAEEEKIEPALAEPVALALPRQDVYDRLRDSIGKLNKEDAAGRKDLLEKAAIALRNGLITKDQLTTLEKV